MLRLLTFSRRGDDRGDARGDDRGDDRGDARGDAPNGSTLPAMLTNEESSPIACDAGGSSMMRTLRSHSTVPVGAEICTKTRL